MAIGRPLNKTFLSVPTAAALAGIPVRRFYRIIEEEHIKVMPLLGKFFIMTKDFEQWAKKFEAEEAAEAAKKSAC